MHSCLGLVALVLLFASALRLQDRVFQNRAATDNLGLRRSTERLSALGLSSGAVRCHPEHSEGGRRGSSFWNEWWKIPLLPPRLLGKSSCAVIVSPLSALMRELSALMREQVQTPSDDQRQIQLCKNQVPWLVECASEEKHESQVPAREPWSCTRPKHECTRAILPWC